VAADAYMAVMKGSQKVWTMAWKICVTNNRRRGNGIHTRAMADASAHSNQTIRYLVCRIPCTIQRAKLTFCVMKHKSSARIKSDHQFH
jgi:hypothetical protein